MTVKVLVPISGGKDSQASLKLAVQTHGAEKVRGLFCDTQFEHPLTYQHIEKLRTLYGPVQIDIVTGGTVMEQCEKHERFPGGGARFCTDELKMRVTRDYCARLAMTNGARFEVWYGVRSEESAQRKKRYAGKVCDELYPMHHVWPGKYPQYLERMGVLCRLCILDWTTGEVFDYLDGHHNPLYDSGFERVGCFPCLAANPDYKRAAFEFDETGRKHFALVQVMEQKIGKSVWTKDGSVPCAVCAI